MIAGPTDNWFAIWYDPSADVSEASYEDMFVLANVAMWQETVSGEVVGLVSTPVSTNLVRPQEIVKDALGTEGTIFFLGYAILRCDEEGMYSYECIYLNFETQINHIYSQWFKED